MDFQIGIVMVPLFVLGITQGLKSVFGIEGKANQIVALIVGFLLTGVSYGIGEGLIPESAAVYIEWFITSLAGSLAAIGFYAFGKSGSTLIRETNGK